MAQLTNIQSIITDVAELNDLLRVISECSGNIPAVLYKLAQEKAQAVAKNVANLSENLPEVPASVSHDCMPPVEETTKPETVSAAICDIEIQSIETAVKEEPVEPVAEKPQAEPVYTSDNTAKTFAEPAEAKVSPKIDFTPKVEEPKTIQNTVHSAPVIDNTVNAQTNTRLLDDILKQRIASKDIRKAISLNDRFRFKRDLFGGSDDAMCKTIEILNQKESAEDALNYLEANFQWDYESETTVDFITIIEKRFSL